MVVSKPGSALSNPLQPSGTRSSQSNRSVRLRTCLNTSAPLAIDGNRKEGFSVEVEVKGGSGSGNASIKWKWVSKCFQSTACTPITFPSHFPSIVSRLCKWKWKWHNSCNYLNHFRFQIDSYVRFFLAQQKVLSLLSTQLYRYIIGIVSHLKNQAKVALMNL